MRFENAKFQIETTKAMGGRSLGTIRFCAARLYSHGLWPHRTHNALKQIEIVEHATLQHVMLGEDRDDDVRRQRRRPRSDRDQQHC
jgi:hypothetical protein